MTMQFNWNRFYNELEEGDPKKFPYWMFFLNEMNHLVAHLISGVVIGIALLSIALGTFSVAWKWAMTQPEVLTKFCESILR